MFEVFEPQLRFRYKNIKKKRKGQKVQIDKVLRIKVFSDDFYSQTYIESLIMRDPRTMVPEEDFRIDVALIYVTSKEKNRTIAKIKSDYQKSKVIVLTSDYDTAFINFCNKEHVKGILFRDDVQCAIVPYMIRTYNLAQDEVALSGNIRVNERSIHPNRYVRIPFWKPCPGLSYRLEQAANLRLVRGLSANTACHVMGIESSSIDRHLSNAYKKIIYNPFIDDSDFSDIILEKLTKEIQGFIWYTALPLKGKLR